MVCSFCASARSAVTAMASTAAAATALGVNQRRLLVSLIARQTNSSQLSRDLISPTDFAAVIALRHKHYIITLAGTSRKTLVEIKRLRDISIYSVDACYLYILCTVLALGNTLHLSLRFALRRRHASIESVDVGHIKAYLHTYRRIYVYMSTIIPLANIAINYMWRCPEFICLGCISTVCDSH